MNIGNFLFSKDQEDLKQINKEIKYNKKNLLELIKLAKENGLSKVLLIIYALGSKKKRNHRKTFETKRVSKGKRD